MKITTSILVIGLAVAGAFAESDEVDAQYFHPAAGLYIHGDSAGASNLVEKGLSLYPDDGKLKRLKELLEKQQEQQQDQENQDQQQNDQEQDPQEQDPQQDDQSENEENPQQEEDQGQEPQPEPQEAEQMSEDEAKQLLDAMRQEEKNKRLQLHPVMGDPVNVDKDW